MTEAPEVPAADARVDPVSRHTEGHKLNLADRRGELLLRLRIVTGRPKLLDNIGLGSRIHRVLGEQEYWISDRIHWITRQRPYRDQYPRRPGDRMQYPRRPGDRIPDETEFTG